MPAAPQARVEPVHYLLCEAGPHHGTAERVRVRDIGCSAAPEAAAAREAAASTIAAAASASPAAAASAALATAQGEPEDRPPGLPLPR
jgi:hypothetical protein